MTTITVLQDDIDNGIQLNFGRCPVALAVRRELPETTTVAVWDEKMAWSSADLYLRDIPLPAEARYFIRQFDHGLPVQPFKFEIEIQQ